METPLQTKTISRPLPPTASKLSVETRVVAADETDGSSVEAVSGDPIGKNRDPKRFSDRAWAIVGPCR